MPLQLGEFFLGKDKVIEIYPPEINGNYRLERYKVLDVFCGIMSAYIFYVDDVEYKRDTRYGLMDMLIEFHMKYEVLNLYPLRVADAANATL